MKKTKTDYKKFIEASKRVAKAEAEAVESQRPSARVQRLFEESAISGEAFAKRRLLAKILDENLTPALMLKMDMIIAYLDEQYEKQNGRE